jgi:hypothetical protein
MAVLLAAFFYLFFICGAVVVDWKQSRCRATKKESRGLKIKKDVVTRRYF